jgi:hypothetical protein
MRGGWRLRSPAFFCEQHGEKRPKKNLRNSGFSLSSEATAEGRYGRMAGFPAIVRQRLVAANHHAHHQSMNAVRDPRACRESEMS